MAKRGVKTILNDSVILQLRNHVLAGMNIKDIAVNTGLNQNTLYDWRNNNYLNLQDKWNTWELQRKLKLAEEFSESLLSYKDLDNKGELNTKLLSIKQREAEFLRSTLLIARNKYDKRDVPSNNNNVQINIVNYTASKDTPVVPVVHEVKQPIE